MIELELFLIKGDLGGKMSFGVEGVRDQPLLLVLETNVIHGWRVMVNGPLCGSNDDLQLVFVVADAAKMRE